MGESRAAYRVGRSSWSASLIEAGLLMLLSLLLAVGVWVLRPDRLPLAADLAALEVDLEAPLVDIPTARTLYEEGRHLFIDTRPDTDADMVTIPGAFLIRSKSFDEDLLAVFDFMLPEDPLILFGGGNLIGTNNVASLLLERGYLDLSILQGGLVAWQAADGPTSLRDTAEAGS